MMTLPVAFWNGTRDEYFALYEATVQAIKAVDPAIPVGGPATSNSKWVRSFLQFCRERKLPVDFVSTHQYAGDPLGGVEDQGGMEETDDGFDLEAMIEGMRQAAGRMQQLEEKTFLKPRNLWELRPIFLA